MSAPIEPHRFLEWTPGPQHSSRSWSNDYVVINRIRAARGLPPLITPEQIAATGDRWLAEHRRRRRLLLYDVLIVGLAFLAGWIGFGVLQ